MVLLSLETYGLPKTFLVFMIAPPMKAIALAGSLRVAGTRGRDCVIPTSVLTSFALIRARALTMGRKCPLASARMVMRFVARCLHRGMRPPRQRRRRLRRLLL